ncbi:MAG: carbon starvation protein A, partial [Deltaproteobacteria bacterium]|nr:carbon starvation protein A [Deltaproteobacteria bacterium]
MNVLLVMLGSAVALVVGGRLYSRYLARILGESTGRTTPAIEREDGRDFVPTPTPVVFAHHFASIAGAGPIVGPVIAIIYGWVPALLWVLFGGLFIGAAHDHLATYIATREGGVSIATVVRRVIGKDAFVAITIFVVVLLALVCAAFLNLSATALTSTLEYARVGLTPAQTLFRTTGDGRVVIGGIASMSVVIITAVAPLVGWLYIRRGIRVWICSLLAVGICAGSIAVGLFQPLTFDPMTWKLLLSGYVLVAAGVPVWIFLQSRDFINVHILYIGMAGLLVTLVVASLGGTGGADLAATATALPAWNLEEGSRANGWFWPGLFIIIACGAVSGFHSLCAGGTTCKQLRSEAATRHVGYFAMLLESFLAVCVIGVLMLGISRSDYITDVHAFRLLGIGGPGDSNPVLAFAMAVGNAGRLAFDAPVAVGALAGMVLLEGFLVTTLDTAVRLTRYLLEEIWQVLFAGTDVFSSPAEAGVTPRTTRGLQRGLLKLLRHYWINSGLAVGLMLAFALTGGQKALWKIFATSNQLLAAMVLGLAALWLLRRGRRAWFAVVPAALMLVTTAVSLVLELLGYLKNPAANASLLVANVVIMAITAYLLVAGLRALRGILREGRRAAGSPAAWGTSAAGDPGGP